MQYSILTVDDHNLNNRIVKSILESVYEIDTALDGATTLQMIQNKKYDLVLLDIGLPDISGFDIAVTLKKLQIPFIFISGSVTTEYITKGYSYGALDYIRKPINADELKFRIESHLELINVKTNYTNKIDKMKKDMLNIFSHEFNTPLNSILNFSEYIQRNITKELNPKKIEKLENLAFKIAQNGYKLKEVHESLFQLSSIQAENFIGDEKIEVSLLLQELKQKLQGRFDTNIAIECEMEFIITNYELFKLLMENLMKFTFKRAKSKGVLQIQNNPSTQSGIIITLYVDDIFDMEEFTQVQSLLEDHNSINTMDYQGFDNLEVLILNALLEKFDNSIEILSEEEKTKLQILLNL